MKGLARACLGIGLTIAVSACASGAGGGPEPVRVFFDAEEVPCAFEEAGEVTAEVRLEAGRSQTMRERDIARALGREGGRAGFDAVLYDPQEPERTRVVRVDLTDSQAQSPPPTTLRAVGLRYLEVGCSTALAGR